MAKRKRKLSYAALDLVPWHVDVGRRMRTFKLGTDSPTRRARSIFRELARIECPPKHRSELSEGLDIMIATLGGMTNRRFSSKGPKDEIARAKRALAPSAEPANSASDSAPATEAPAGPQESGYVVGTSDEPPPPADDAEAPAEGPSPADLEMEVALNKGPNSETHQQLDPSEPFTKV